MATSEVVYKTENIKGKYSCGDLGISELEWLQLLKSPEAEPYLNSLLCFLREPNHTSSCSAVAAKHGKPAAHYNAKVTNFSKWVQRKLNRFKVLDIDGNITYWTIAMQNGWYSKQGFNWQMRDELVAALQHLLMERLVSTYREKTPFNGFKEEYKWELLDITEGKGAIDIVKSLRGKNIVDNARVDSVMRNLCEAQEEELTAVIEHLLDEATPIDKRIAHFKAEMKDICPSDWKIYANDERTASAILMCRYPQKYTIYKDEIYQLLCRYFGFESRKAGLKFSHFIEIIDKISAEFGEEIQEIMMPSIGKFKNKPLNLAVQTLFWCMRNEMKKELDNEIEMTDEEIMPQQRYKEYIELLEATHNLVLNGAPGTGKTYMAHEIAKEMGAETAFVQFHPSYDYTDFVEGLRPVENENGQMGFERRDGVFKEFCRKAQKNLIDASKSVESLSREMSWQEQLNVFIEDAIESEERFKTVNGSVFTISEMKGHNIIVHIEQNIVTTQVAVNSDEILELLSNEVDLNIVRDIRNYFQRKFGTQADSYAFVIAKAVRAMKKKVPTISADKIDRKPFVFIIDEINRGEVSKIFGELFFAIDPGYRGKQDHAIQTQYQNLVPETDVFAKGFFVPENVYILATMNDIDRSVESMDFAMRRRFTWKEITPDDTERMLDDLDCAAEAKDRMHLLNDAIAKTEGLGAAYMVGPSYFLKLKDNGGDFEKLWEMNIEPLLKEYLRGFRKAHEIMQKFNDAYFKTNESIANDGNPELTDD